jgi:opacity protein-like surface antigen
MRLNKTTIFLITLLVNLSAYAADNDKKFYFKLTAGDSRILPIKENNDELKFSSTNYSSLSPSLGFGAGYYINNTFRTDLLLEHFNFHFNKDSNNFEETEDNILTIGAKTIKRTTYGKSITCNGYVNILDKNFYKVFIGGGMGIAQIKERMTHLVSGNSINDGLSYNFPLIVEKYTSKNTNNFTYSFTVGTDIEINPAMDFELSYSWRNFGKTKYADSVIITNKYKGHYLSAALRFNL